MQSPLSRCASCASSYAALARPFVRALSAATAAAAAPVAPPSASTTGLAPLPAAPPRANKDKGHFKRASNVMAAINKDAVARMAVKMALFRPPLPDFNVGDAIEIDYAQELAEVKPLPIRGTVMGKIKRGLDTKFSIINSWDGEWYQASYPTSSPLLRGVKVLQRNHLTEGLRRARRAKLTHLVKADPTLYLVDANTKEADILAAEKEARRVARRSGKPLSKKDLRSAEGGKAVKGKGGAPAAGAGGKAAGAAAPAAAAKGAAPAAAKGAAPAAGGGGKGAPPPKK